MGLSIDKSPIGMIPLLVIKKGNKIVSLSVSPDKVKELKIKAVQAGMSLSAFMVSAASEISVSQVANTRTLNKK